MDTHFGTTSGTLKAETTVSQTDRSLRCAADGWEYETYFREWAADYGTYIDTHRQFTGTDPESVLLQALMALLGIGERWMV